MLLMMLQIDPLLLAVLLVLLIRQCAASDQFPQILSKASNQTSNLSSNAILTCHIRDLGDHHVTWFKLDPLTSQSHPLAVGEQLFTPDPRFSISSYSMSARESFWSLEIYQLNLSDEGTYLCKIANRRASVSIALYLHVQTPMHLSPSHLYVEPGSEVKLNCSVSIGHEQNQSSALPISWHFLSAQHNRSKPNGTHVRTRWISHSLISYLIINHAQTYHSGIWTCMHKRQRRTARLIVEKDIGQRQRTSALLSNDSNRVVCRSLVLLLLSLLWNSIVR